MVRAKTVLLIDDDPDDQFLLMGAITRTRTDIIFHTAEDGEEALKKLQEIKKVDVIFLDLNMPVMDGKEFLRLIKLLDDLKKIPVVVLTTSSDSKDREFCMKLGAFQFITKPSTFADLCNRMESLFQEVVPEFKHSV